MASRGNRLDAVAHMKFCHSRIARILGTATLVHLAACGGDAAKPTGPALDLTTITDINPEPNIVEVNLVAAVGETQYIAGKATQIWGYQDGSKPGAGPIVPGPTIEARKGDTVIVHFRNELPEGTTIHWHGIRVPNGADGTHATQHEIHAGATFDYEFTVMDPGTFWFHPHVRSDVQIERGLYGMLLVRGGTEVPASADRAFILDDVKLDDSGQIAPFVDSDLMIGRQGDLILANGRAGGRIRVKNGARERWRFANAANARYFSLRLKGHKFTVVGWDGGILPEPYQVETVLIAPGERYEVLVDLKGEESESLPLETLYYFRAHGMPYVDPAPIFWLDFEGRAEAPAPLPTTWGPAPDIEINSSTVVQNLVFKDEEAHSETERPRFLINDLEHPNVPDIHGTSDDIEIWNIKNEGEMDHPFHLHGMFFKVLDVNGEPPDHQGWKDTVNLKHPATMRIAIRYGGVGRWMYHCHILEHAENGMMAELVLSPKK
jgi:FtsP/CotA-like multicopper oxidase with cupredoxin domain